MTNKMLPADPAPGESVLIPDAPTRAVFEHLRDQYGADYEMAAWCPWCGLLVPLTSFAACEANDGFIVHETGYVVRPPEEIFKNIEMVADARLRYGTAFLPNHVRVFELAAPGFGTCYGSRMRPSDRPVELSAFEEVIAAAINEHVYSEELDYDGPELLRGAAEAAVVIHAEINVRLDAMEAARDRRSVSELFAIASELRVAYDPETWDWGKVDECRARVEALAATLEPAPATGFEQ